MFQNIIWLILILLLFAILLYAIPMPGKSYRGELPALTNQEKAIENNLMEHVSYLASDIGERNSERYQNLIAAQNYIVNVLKNYGYTVTLKSFQSDGKIVSNIETKISGSENQNEIIILGAHYDTVAGSPGADDNASGVAVLLELARLLRNQKSKCSIYFVFFVNEEPPYFWTRNMGSYVYAKELKRNKTKIKAMFSIESVGYYSDEQHSQRYPVPFNFFYPNKGNFIAFVGNLSSRSLVRRSLEIFRNTTQFPSEGIAAPAWIPGISWSDQTNFWHYGYPAVMITDTVPYRNPHYHQASDKPATLAYDCMARVVQGLGNVVLGINAL